MSLLSIDGNSIYYEYRLGKEPCLILSHGFGMSNEIWQQTIEQTHAAGFAVLAYDHRCCGKSDMAFSDVTIATQGSDIVALCDHLKLDKVVLNGWSLGGAIVVDAAAKLKDRVSGLVLTGGATPRYTQADGFPHGGQPADIEATVAALRADRPGFLKGLYFEGVFVAPVDDALKERCVTIALQAGEASDDSLGDLAHLDQRELMPQLSCPALIFHGLDDGVVPIGIGRVANELLANSEMIELPECGHAPFLEYPAAYQQSLLNFLNRLTD